MGTAFWDLIPDDTSYQGNHEAGLWILLIAQRIKAYSQLNSIIIVIYGITWFLCPHGQQCMSDCGITELHCWNNCAQSDDIFTLDSTCSLPPPSPLSTPPFSTPLSLSFPSFLLLISPSLFFSCLLTSPFLPYSLSVFPSSTLSLPLPTSPFRGRPAASALSHGPIQEVIG